MLKIYNTLTRQKEIFQPIHPGRIKIYVCGVTVYDYCHLGHARTYTSMDVIIRYLRFHGYDIVHVRNITDIDDKIIKRANEMNEDYRMVAQRFAKAMHEDFNSLCISAPDHEPLATEHIPQMISLIKKIIERNHAYVAANGDVYFDVRSFANYGCLSHHNLEELKSGVRIEVSDVKRDPLDFVLWKLAKPGEPMWDSPWGRGRPGWHIECSAMAVHLLGEHFDIHAGGLDLIFPHHENEIAQSESITQQTFASFWIHCGFLQMEKEKMSKSLGNVITIRDVLRDHDKETVRFFLIASQYRSPIIYTEEALHQATHALKRFYTALRFLEKADPASNTRFEKQFIDAMDDDFNTPVALSVLFDLAHEIQRLRDTHAHLAAAYGALLKKLGCVFGILQTDPEIFFQSGLTIDPIKIEALIAKRKEARAHKNWAQADRIRDELAKMHIVIEDTGTGTTWKKDVR